MLGLTLELALQYSTMRYHPFIHQVTSVWSQLLQVKPWEILAQDIKHYCVLYICLDWENTEFTSSITPVICVLYCNF